MKILAMDIGAGTVDILLHETGSSFENSVKMVLPSPTRVYAKKVADATLRGVDIFIDGDIIGGGALAAAVKKHLSKELKVFMTAKAGQSIRNDPDEVTGLGVKIIEGEPPDGFRRETLTLEEVSPLRLEGFLREHGEIVMDVDAVAIAVKDHGAAPKGVSSRRFRMGMFEERIREDPRAVGLAYKGDNVPRYLTRMISGVDASRRQLPDAEVVTMDTSPAAIVGCLTDPVVRGAGPLLAVNVGNGHTMAAIVTSGKIMAVAEHHTGMLDPAKLERMLVDFAAGKLSDRGVFEGGGHGAFYVEEAPGYGAIEVIAVTGPRRAMIEGTTLDYVHAAPGGDVMMTGPIGLIESSKVILG